MKRADEYQKELTRALSAKRASDLALQEAAAEARGASTDRLIIGGIAALFLVGWGYTKLTHVSPWALGKVVTDHRTGGGEPNQAIAAIDSAISPLQQSMTKAHVWFQNKLSKVLSP